MLDGSLIEHIISLLWPCSDNETLLPRIIMSLRNAAARADFEVSRGLYHEEKHVM